MIGGEFGGCVSRGKTLSIADKIAILEKNQDAYIHRLSVWAKGTMVSVSFDASSHTISVTISTTDAKQTTIEIITNDLASMFGLPAEEITVTDLGAKRQSSTYNLEFVVGNVPSGASSIFTGVSFLFALLVLVSQLF